MVCLQARSTLWYATACDVAYHFMWICATTTGPQSLYSLPGKPACYACRPDQPVSQASELRLARKRQRWSLPPGNDTSADKSPPSSQDLGLVSQQGQDEQGLVPLSVVMEACLVQGVLEQYKCVSKACLG